MEADGSSGGSVKPHQLCDICQRLADTYAPSDLATEQAGMEYLRTQQLVEPQDEAYVRARVNQIRLTKEPADFTDLQLFWATRQPVQHHRGFYELQNSAAGGCHLCSLLVASNQRKGLPTTAEHAPLWVVADLEGYEGNYRVPEWEHAALCLVDGVPTTELERESVRCRALATIYVTRWFNDLREDITSESIEDCQSQPAPAISQQALLDVSQDETPMLSAKEPLGFESGDLGLFEDLIHHSSIAAQQELFKAWQQASSFRWSCSTGSREASSLIRKWLEVCQNDHESCTTAIGDHPPTRLLDLEADLTPQNIRLILTQDVGRHPYVTLSYRWAEHTSVLLTDQTYNAFLSRIDLGTLPRTIQEAVQVCRNLKIRYLWVDALCIIQGNKEDFATEISRMGSIYASSVLTIAATAASDANAGFMKRRYPLYTDHCYVQNSNESTLFFANEPAHDHDDLEDCEMNSRGWVYQERTLSPRTIHFCKTTVIWECRRQQVCQRCVVDCRTVRPVHGLGQKAMFDRIATEATRATTIPSDFQLTWDLIIATFSEKSFSYDSDRLSALAGLAHLMNRDHGYKSSYGLWLPFFRDQIFWGCIQSSASLRPKRKIMPGVPSWSWISTQGRVDMNAYRLDSTNYVVGTSMYHLEPANYMAEITKLPPPTGFSQLSVHNTSSETPVTFRICGWMVHCKAVPYASEWSLQSADEKLTPEGIELEEASWRNWLDGHPDACSNVEDSYRWRFHPDDELVRSQRLAYMPVRHVSSLLRLAGKQHVNVQEHGLILTPVSPTGSVYKRVGVSSRFLKWERLDPAVREAHNEAYESNNLPKIQKILMEHDAIVDKRKAKVEIEIG